MRGFVALVVSPVGLQQDGVDLLEVDGFGLVADCFDEAADGEVFDGAEGAFGAAGDEVEGGFGEGAVREVLNSKLSSSGFTKLTSGDLGVGFHAFIEFCFQWRRSLRDDEDDCGRGWSGFS